MVGNMNKWKDEPYPWANEPVNTNPKEFKDSVWASGDRKPVHDEPCYAVYEDKYPVKKGHLLFSRMWEYSLRHPSPSHPHFEVSKPSPNLFAWTSQEYMAVSILYLHC